MSLLLIDSFTKPSNTRTHTCSFGSASSITFSTNAFWLRFAIDYKFNEFWFVFYNGTNSNKNSIIKKQFPHPAHPPDFVAGNRKSLNSLNQHSWKVYIARDQTKERANEQITKETIQHRYSFWRERKKSGIEINHFTIFFGKFNNAFVQFQTINRKKLRKKEWQFPCSFSFFFAHPLRCPDIVSFSCHFHCLPFSFVIILQKD